MTTSNFAKRFAIFLCGALALPVGAAEEPTIDSSKSAFYVGQSVMMCGVVSDVTPFSRGTYLNFGGRYPKQHITVVVWDSDAAQFNERFGNLQAFTGQRACARGVVSQFRNALQIKVSNPQFLQLMK